MSQIRYRRSDEQTEGLCLVTGRFLLTNGNPFPGRIVITPEGSGYFNGVYYASLPAVMRPDADGRISIYMPPSDIVGDYNITSKPPSISLTFTIDAGDEILNLGDVT